MCTANDLSVSAAKPLIRICQGSERLDQVSKNLISEFSNMLIHLPFPAPPGCIPSSMEPQFSMPSNQLKVVALVAIHIEVANGPIG